MQNIKKRKLLFIEKNGVLNFRIFFKPNPTHLLTFALPFLFTTLDVNKNNIEYQLPNKSSLRVGNKAE